MIAIDTETTGVDFRHASRPFFVTLCEDGKDPTYYEWDVDPLTRIPTVPPEDIEEIGQVIHGPGIRIDRNGEIQFNGVDLVFQNVKFDVTALQSIWGKDIKWPWHRTYDTLIAGHLLASNRPHDLTSMAMDVLGVDIAPLEVALAEAVTEARALVTRHARKYESFKCWKLASREDPTCPSARNPRTQLHKLDMWLPRTLARILELPETHPWWTVLSEYAVADSMVTVALWKAQKEEIKKRDHWEIYLERMKCHEVAYAMENYGVTGSLENHEKITCEFRQEARTAEKLCINLAKGYDYDLVVPKSGANDSLRTFLFDHLKLPPIHNPKAKSDAPSLNKDAMTHYQATLPEKSKELFFINQLLGKRARDTAVSYLESYEWYWRTDGTYFRLHPNLNPTGTDTLRWSCQSPNEQNISKREGFNLRVAFGPAEGREWWSIDAKNIERRIPAYEAGETEIINLFEHPDDPPYFGSEHLLVAHILHKKKFEQCISCRRCKGEVKVPESLVTRDSKFCTCARPDAMIDGRIFKKRYAATLYQWTKNGNFGIQYGAQRATADRTYRVRGAYDLVKRRFSKQDALNQYWVDFANEHGYIETIPDKTVNPKRGYPLLCSRSEWGRISPTIPLNYHVSGSAMWWTMKAMNRCHYKLAEWREMGFDGHMPMQVHDELVFDFPKSPMHPSKDDGKGFRVGKSNLWRIRLLQDLMALGGNDLGLPTPTGCEYHEFNWSEGVTF